MWEILCKEEFKMNDDGISLFREFLRDEENEGLIRELFPLILDAVEKASREDNRIPLKILFEEIEGTELENEPVFRKFNERNPPGWEGSI